MKPTTTIFKRIGYATLAAALVLGISPAGPALAATGASATAAGIEQTAEQADGSFVFSDEGIAANADASTYKVSGTELTITAAGTYEVSGSCADGSICVKKGVSGVTIVLDGLTLAKDGDKAIKFKAGCTGNKIVVIGDNTLSTSNDKGIIKANAAQDESGNTVVDSDGNVTGGDLTISGSGTLNLSSTYRETVNGETLDCDAINCEGDLTVLSGTYNIDVTDDGMHADYVLSVGEKGSTGPTINIANATEGLEGATVNLYSGTGTIKTSDDGINAANSDLTAYGYQYGITVAGGTWKVVAGGDGLDSNGNLTVSGGATEVYCTGNGNGALDYGEGAEGEIEGTFSYTGGTLLAVGNDMLVTPSKGAYTLFGGQGAAGGRQSSAGNVVTKGSSVKVTAGSKTLYSTTAAASGSYAVFMSDELASGTSCTLTNGNSTSTATAKTGSTGNRQMGQAPSGQQMDTSRQQGANGQQDQNGQQGQPGQQGQFPGQPPQGQQGQSGQQGQFPGQPPQGQQGTNSAQQDGQQGFQMPDFAEFFKNFFGSNANGGNDAQQGQGAGDTREIGDNASPTTAARLKSGDTVTAGSGATKAAYTIVKTAENGTGTVAYTTCKVSSKATKATVPASVKIQGKTYKVVGISKGAFKSKSKVKTVTVKSSKLTKKGVKGALKGSKVKTVKVKVSSKSKTNKKYTAKYAKYFAKSNSGKGVTVK